MILASFLLKQIIFTLGLQVQSTIIVSCLKMIFNRIKIGYICYEFEWICFGFFRILFQTNYELRMKN